MDRVAPELRNHLPLSTILLGEYFKGENMKIISKHHDYYDDMAYVYGVDDRLQLIRPSVLTNEKLNKNAKVDTIVANIPKFGFYFPSRYHYGELEINGNIYCRNEVSVSVFCFFGRFCVKYSAKTDVRFECSEESSQVNLAHNLLKTPVFEIEGVRNYISDSEIQIGEYKKGYSMITVFNNIPTLKSFGLDKEISADKMYSIAEQWVRNQKTNEELINLSNKEKIVKAGFDLKDSFRNTGEK